MQELTTEICKSVTTATATTGNNYQLVDSRDNKVYYVAKLADGNCWMTQNLDFDGGGARRTVVGEWINENTMAQYMDPGLKVGNADGANATSSTDAHTLVGNYYSWDAATNDVCPLGWQLPTSNNTSSGSFGKLTGGLNFTTIQAAPYYFQAGGYTTSGTLSTAGTYGYYWSSTAGSATNAYHLLFASSIVNPSGSNARHRGMSIRCLVLGS